MNYTIRLTHGQAFMAGVFDSAGNSWAVGPLHSGDGSDLSCLAVSTGQALPSTSGGVGIGAMAGGIVGAFIVGALGALGVGYALYRRKEKRRVGREILRRLWLTKKQSAAAPRGMMYPYNDPRPAMSQNGSFGKADPTGAYHDISPGVDSHVYDPNQPHSATLPPGLPSLAMYDPSSATFPGYPGTPTGPASRARPASSMSNPYDEQMMRSKSAASRPDMGASSYSNGSVPGRRTTPTLQASQSKQRWRPTSMGPVSPTSMSSDEDSFGDESGSASGLKHVYVVHSDGGNVHIQLPAAGANVIELPPNYTDEPGPSQPESSAAAARSQLSPETATTQTSGPSSTGDDNPMRRPSAADRAALPYLDLEQATTQSGRNWTEDELRARAQAALAEKDPSRVQ